MILTVLNVRQRKKPGQDFFAISAAHRWCIEHMDVVNEFVHEPPMHKAPIYVREPPGSDGKTTGQLKRNLWGGRWAGHD